MNVMMHEFDELCDSRELYETRPFPFSVYFTYIALSFVIIFLLWTSFSEIDVVVKSRGKVRPFEETNVISNTINGRIEAVNYNNGDFVEKGNVIVKLSLDEFEAEHRNVLKQVETLEKEIVLLDMFKKAIEENTNLFNIENGYLEENYYYMFKKYEMDLINSVEKSKLYSVKVNNSNAELQGCQYFLQSIETGKDSFNEALRGTESYQEYQSYLIKFRELSINLDSLKKESEIKKKLFESGGVSANDYKSSKLDYDQSENQLNKYVSDTKLQLKSKISNYTETVYNYEGELSTQSNFKTQTLININDKYKIKSQELDRLKVTMNALNINMGDTELVAPVSGYVNYSSEFAVGQFLSPGIKIATIIPEDGEMFKIQILVPNKDITNIEVGDKVKYRFDALPYKEYGVLEGVITNISVDASINENEGVSYYLVEGTVPNRALKSYKGTVSNIKVGMRLEAQIISGSKKVLHLLLEKMDFLN